MVTFENYPYQKGSQLDRNYPPLSKKVLIRDAANEETEYTYDANGNMLTDNNKGITSIDYNVLDLPQCIKT